MSGINMNDLSLLVTLLTAKVNNLESKFAELENSRNSVAIETGPVKKTKSSKSQPKPEGYPKQPTPVHIQYEKYAKEQGFDKQITENIKKLNPSITEKDLKKQVKEEIMKKWAQEKGHVLFDEKGKPTDKSDVSKYSEIAKKIHSEFKIAKEEAEKLKKEFLKTEEGIKYEEDSKNKSSEAKATKSKNIKKDVSKGQDVQVPAEFADLTNGL